MYVQNGLKMGGNTELQSSVEDDLREQVPLQVLYYPLLISWLTLHAPWFATLTVKSVATHFLTSWVFRVTTPDAPELKYCCAKSIFTSRGMTSKNKPYPTCYHFWEVWTLSSHSPRIRLLLMASHVIVTFHSSCPWCYVFIVSLTVVLLFILL